MENKSLNVLSPKLCYFCDHVYDLKVEILFLIFFSLLTDF